MCEAFRSFSICTANGMVYAIHIHFDFATHLKAHLLCTRSNGHNENRKAQGILRLWLIQFKNIAVKCYYIYYIGYIYCAFLTYEVDETDKI